MDQCADFTKRMEKILAFCYRTLLPAALIVLRRSHLKRS